MVKKKAGKRGKRDRRRGRRKKSHSRRVSEAIGSFYSDILLPQFSRDEYLPKKVVNWQNRKNTVPMALCMAVLLFTSLTGSNIQQGVEILDQQRDVKAMSLELYGLDNHLVDFYEKPIPLPNDIRRSLRVWTPVQLMTRYKRVNRRLVAELKRNKAFQRLHGKEGVTVAFDMTEVDYFGEGDGYTMFTKGRSAAQRCHTYLSLQIVCPGFRVTLDMEPVYRKEIPDFRHKKDTSGEKVKMRANPLHQPLGKQMRRMLSRWRKFGLKFKYIYLDRGFYQIEVLRELRKFHGIADSIFTINDLNEDTEVPSMEIMEIMEIMENENSKDIEQATSPESTGSINGLSMMPVIRNPRIKDTIGEWYERHGFKAGYMPIVMGKGKNKLEYQLIFSPLEKQYRERLKHKKKDVGIHELFLFFCLLEAPASLGIVDNAEEVFEYLSYEYRKRWGIETGYRVVKQIWGWTTSQDYTLRVWLAWNSVILYNLWVMENLKLLQEKGIPQEYQCCNLPIEEMRVLRSQERDKRKKLRALSKLPAKKRARNTRENPLISWKPKPLIRLWEFCLGLEELAHFHLFQIYRDGYDPSDLPDNKIDG